MAKVKLILSIYVLILALALIYGGLMAEARKLNIAKKESVGSSTVEKMVGPVGSLHRTSNINTAGGSKTKARPSAAEARRSSAGADQLVTESGLDVQSTTPGHSPGVGHSIGPAGNEPNP